MSKSKESVPIEDGLFTWPSDEPRLIGSECPECGDVTFPESTTCGNPDCMQDSMDRTELSITGTLYSYTVHNVELKEPYSYHSEPYAIGTIELPEGLNIVSKLTVVDDDELEIGMEMDLTVDELYEDEDSVYVTYFFEPTDEP